MHLYGYQKASSLSKWILFLGNLLVTTCNSLEVLMVSACETGHATPNSGLVRALVQRGHKVDVLFGGKCAQKHADKFVGAESLQEGSFFPLPNFQDKGDWTVLSEFESLMFTNATQNCLKAVDDILQTKKYDVVLADWMLTGAALASRKNGVPVLSAYQGTMPTATLENVRTRETLHIAPPSTLPGFISRFIDNFVWVLVDYVYSHKIFTAVRENAKYTGEDVLDEENDGLLPYSFLVRRNVLIHHGLPQISFVQEDDWVRKDNVHFIGYIPDHYEKLKQGEVLSFIEKCPKPLIFMSLGTHFGKPLPVLQSYLKILESQNDYCFLWTEKPINYNALSKDQTKFERLLLSSNVPQQDILLHNKVKAFLTHAGANSVYEAVYAMKPMLLHPLVGDQVAVSSLIVQKGFGSYLLDIGSKEVLLDTLDTFLAEENYKEMVLKLGKYQKIMASLGGYQKGAEIVEKVANKSILVEPLNVQTPIINFVSVVKQELVRDSLIITGLLLGALACFYFLVTKVCCRAIEKEKNL